MKLYFLEDELNALLNITVLCNEEDYAEIHSKYLECCYKLENFKKWFHEDYIRSAPYLGIENIVFTRK